MLFFLFQISNTNRIEDLKRKPIYHQRNTITSPLSATREVSTILYTNITVQVIQQIRDRGITQKKKTCSVRFLYSSVTDCESNYTKGFTISERDAVIVNEKHIESNFTPNYVHKNCMKKRRKK